MSMHLDRLLDDEQSKVMINNLHYRVGHVKISVLDLGTPEEISSAHQDPFW